MFSIVVMFSGYGSNLQAIIDKCYKTGNVDITLAITDNKEAYGIERARIAEIPSVVVEQQKGQTREDYCNNLIDILSKVKVDLIVLAGFMKILTPNFINTFPNKIINVHPSLLPKYKGGGEDFSTHRLVMQNKDAEHGMTIHWVTEKVDEGPIIVQRRFPILSDDNEETIEHKVHQLEHIWFPWVVNYISR